MKKGKFNLVVLIICFFIVFIIGYLGSIFTDTGSWYESIKPKIAPPNYWFGIVWTILYIMIAFSIYFSWIGSEKKGKEKHNNILWNKFNIKFFMELYLFWL